MQVHSGKSHLLCDPPLLASLSRNSMIGKWKVQSQLWDTAGQERFRSMVRNDQSHTHVSWDSEPL